jgi:hypothetical protein
MKLLTKALLKKLPAYGSQDGKGDDAIAYVKFFDPCGSWTWYGMEFDPENREFFGLVYGFEMEYGPFSLDELESVKNRMGLEIERDRSFKPTKIGDVKKLHSERFGQE